MADFNIAYKTVRSNEGGYRNVSWDAGGETYKGVARVYNPKWPGWAIIDAIKKTRTIKLNEVIKDARLDQLVVDLFKEKYWTPNKLSGLNNQSLATLCFDMVINHGRGPVLINTAANSIRPVTGGTLVTTDSVRVLNAYPEQGYNAIAAARVKYVESLKSSLGADYEGVLARAKRFLTQYRAEIITAAKVGGGLLIAGVLFFF